MSPISKDTPLKMPETELGKSFEPRGANGFEDRIYEFWEKSGCFEASDENVPGQESFCMMLPPPNVTGVLHMGHALTGTVEDILSRWHRMKGFNVLWLPGTDHAGIATQAQVEKQIAKEKNASGKPLNRHDIGREEFIKRTWDWTHHHHDRIVGQMKRMGSSVDWKRERFTLDDGFTSAVKEVFVRLYEEKLIYRGERIINWCCRCQTALSDLEVIPTDRKGALYHIRYIVSGTKGGPGNELIVATTRPETLLGDTAVAIHPDDERFQSFHGKKVELPLLGRVIPIITDTYVEKEFGTGALKVTPAHDFNDYDLGKKHNLPAITVMGKLGKITEEGGPYAGLKFDEAREKVVEDLKSQGLLVKVEDHMHKVGLCQRCDRVAEPIISKQWFVNTRVLAKPSIEAVEKGKIVFYPKSWEKTYFEWMYNIRDWCISRQLWWGHQIPAWYCDQCEGVTVAKQTPSKCSECGAGTASLKQDEDVLDTWFSSGLWPFGTLGWPEKTQALKTFYPNAVLETGFDIIFFWVARMIMLGIHFMKDVPFKRVYMHAMVRDEKGEKMSKSKGNVIDPLEVMDKHGADPLRFTFACMAGQGRDIKLSVDRVEGYRAFCNKLWNAVKFMHLQWKEHAPVSTPGGPEERLMNNREDMLPVNKWILSRLQDTIKTVEYGLENFEIDTAAQRLYEFTWYELCDWYIEFVKLVMREQENARAETLTTYHYVIENLLRLLHPFVPFVSEELWQSLPWKEAANTPARERDKKSKIMSIMIQHFPKHNPKLVDVAAEKTIEALKSVIDAVRRFRGENGLTPKQTIRVEYVAHVPAADLFMKMHRAEIMALCGMESLDKISEIKSGSQAKGSAEELVAVIPVSNPPIEFKIPLKGLVNFEEEMKRLQKEVQKARADLDHVQKKLNNEAFVSRAPGELLLKERAREKEIQVKLSELEVALNKVKAHSKT